MICLKVRSLPKTKKRVCLADLLEYKVLRKMTNNVYKKAYKAVKTTL